MKNTLKLIGYLIAGVLIGAVGTSVGFHLASGKSFDSFWESFTEVNGSLIVGGVISSIALLILSFFLQVILHEGGHLICGLATGYKFISFRIFHFTFIRQNGKLRVKCFSVAGTGGQCLLNPPDKPLQDIPCVLYNLGGALANLLTAAVALTMLLTIDEMPHLLHLFLFMICFFGFFLALMNGIPMKIGGIGNDADNIRLLLKDMKSKKAMISQLRVNALLQEGVRPKDMPEEWFEQEEADYKDALQATVRLMIASRLLDMEEWETAHKELEEVYAHKDELIGLLTKETECELLFTALVTGRTEQAEELYSKELETYIQQYKQVMSSKQRQLCALALYREKDTAKAKEIYDTVCRRREKYLMQGEVCSDIALMKSMLSKKHHSF